MNDITDTLKNGLAAQTATDAAYEQWFREKVTRSLHDPRPAIPHDEAMAQVEAELMRHRFVATKSPAPIEGGVARGVDKSRQRQSPMNTPLDEVFGMHYFSASDEFYLM